jgi:hypothetical protein
VTDRFSWFDYRSRGFEDEPKRGLRIDLIMASQPGATDQGSGVDYELRDGKAVGPCADLAGVEDLKGGGRQGACLGSLHKPNRNASPPLHAHRPPR